MLTLAILNYNGLDTLEESIRSVLEQSCRPDRFVVIDNASSDGSHQIAGKMGVEVVSADNKYKFITGLNTALDLVGRDEDLFFMQNDVMLDRFCLETMQKNCPDKEFIAQPVIYDQKNNIDNSGMDIIWPGYGIRRKAQWWDGALYENCGLVTTICFLLRTNQKVRYDERFYPAYYEDLSFYFDYDLNHVLIPAAKAIHKGNHTFSQTLKKKEISNICRSNRKKLIRKHFKGFDRGSRLAVATGLDVVKKTIDIVAYGRIF